MAERSPSIESNQVSSSCLVKTGFAACFPAGGCLGVHAGFTDDAGAEHHRYAVIGADD
jgi:hypothetical protein